MLELQVEPVPQIAWYLQIESEIKNSKKPMDKMPIAEIKKLYDSGYILCDSCGKKTKITETKYSLTDHIIHLINPNSLWSCEGCYLQDKRLGKIIQVPNSTNKE